MRSMLLMPRTQRMGKKLDVKVSLDNKYGEAFVNRCYLHGIVPWLLILLVFGGNAGIIVYYMKTSGFMVRPCGRCEMRATMVWMACVDGVDGGVMLAAVITATKPPCQRSLPPAAPAPTLSCALFSIYS